MKLLLVAPLPLAPYLEILLPNTTHQIDVFYPPDELRVDHTLIQNYILNARDYDAVICADGAGIINDEGLVAGEIPLVIPRVHNYISLLLGCAQAYRSLFARFNGQLCWALPGTKHITHFIPPADATCLCYLADTQLDLRDNSLSAQLTAREYGWDYFHIESDISLLGRLLCGDWDGDDILIVPKNGSVFPTYRHDIIS